MAKAEIVGSWVSIYIKYYNEKCTNVSGLLFLIARILEPVGSWIRSYKVLR